MKVLIVEDIDSISLGIQRIIQEFKDTEIVHAKYCDKALLKYRKALLDDAPFDLIISDLSFKSDYKDCELKNGEEFISAIRKLNQTTPIIVYSIEDKSFLIKNLFQNLDIQAYVLKGRNSTRELIKAIEKVLNNEKYISEELSQILNNKSDIEIEEYDVLLLENLAKGYSQSEISASFSKDNISPASVSAIEKRVNKLKIQFQAKNAIHLVALAKDIGII